MSRSRPLFLLAPVVLLLTCTAQAQTQASCTFTFFGLAFDGPNIGPGFFTPSGINDFGTIVGTGIPSNDQIQVTVGLIRWPNAGTTFPLGTSVTMGADRNDSGTSIGSVGGIPILLNGTNATDVTLNGFSANCRALRH
jgi:hypothetical protein